MFAQNSPGFWSSLAGMGLNRRTALGMLVATPMVGAGAALARPVPAPSGERLAQAARDQVGVTKAYDPSYRSIPYPNGDVLRSTGVCADVLVRAARDAWRVDLQQRVHEDMTRAFAAYPSRRAWGLKGPDSNIDHRRVLNLEAYWRRQGAELWRAPPQTEGHRFRKPLALGDCLTWRVSGRLPHVGVVTQVGFAPLVTHNIGGGTQEVLLATMWLHRASGHYRWPASAAG